MKKFLMAMKIFVIGLIFSANCQAAEFYFLGSWGISDYHEMIAIDKKWHCAEQKIKSFQNMDSLQKLKMVAVLFVHLLGNTVAKE